MELQVAAKPPPKHKDGSGGPQRAGAASGENRSCRFGLVSPETGASATKAKKERPRPYAGEIFNPPNFDNLNFQFAKSMPKTPHCYVKRTPENNKDYEALYKTIRRDGVPEKWYGRSYRYRYRGV